MRCPPLYRIVSLLDGLLERVERTQSRYRRYKGNAHISDICHACDTQELRRVLQIQDMIYSAVSVGIASQKLGFTLTVQ